MTNTKYTSIEDIVRRSDSLRKLQKSSDDQIPNDVFIPNKSNYSAHDAMGSFTPVEDFSRFDKGRQSGQDINEYRSQKKQEFIAEKVIPLSIGLVVLIIIVYAFKDGLGKFLSKIR